MKSTRPKTTMKPKEMRPSQKIAMSSIRQSLVAGTKNVRTAVFLTVVSLGILASQTSQAGFAVEIKSTGPQPAIKIGKIEPLSYQTTEKNKDRARQHSRRSRSQSSEYSSKAVTLVEIPPQAPEAVNIKNIPALPQQVTPVPILQTRIEIPATPQPRNDLSASNSSQITVALKPEVIAREVLTSYDNGMPGHISIIIRTCLNLKSGQPIAYRQITFTDGELQIRSTTDSQGCFQWYQDLYVEVVSRAYPSTALTANSDLAQSEQVQSTHRLFKYYRLSRWLKIDGQSESVKIEFLLNPYLSTTIDGSAKVDSNKILNGKNLSFTGEMFNF